MTRPTAVRFSPDGRIFVAEKSGLIEVFDSLSSPAPTIFADLRTEVDDYWDRGLLGLALQGGEAQPSTVTLRLDAVTASGCGGGKYCPGRPNTRGEMAVFLSRALGLP